jgi:hypothetical protein
MFRNTGWAAFLASVTCSILLGAAPVSANGSSPVFACFSPSNAMAIGRLGADDPSVRLGFETGECVALAPGIPLNDVEREGSLWRFRVFGAAPYLYAADWAMGFRVPGQPAPLGFERYVPVTARLLASGRAFAQCRDDSSRLAARFQDHERRWKRYMAAGRSHPDGASPKTVIHVADTGPRLAAEADALRREANALDQRCSAVASMQADDDFVAFVRTAQRA